MSDVYRTMLERMTKDVCETLDKHENVFWLDKAHLLSCLLGKVISKIKEEGDVEMCMSALRTCLEKIAKFSGATIETEDMKKGPA